ncbi:MAG: CDP-alcohol phosphatidyltransferase family protein [Candidatus Saccharicenans sp.]|nr:CDP-alcohol phosphatidyltransferase family protein [Candidatus Saccharicenans sp.]
MSAKKALIILTEHGSQKLLGLTLLQRIILNANQAGVEEFWLYSPELEKVHRTIAALTADRRILEREIRFKAFSPDKPEALQAENPSEFLIITKDNSMLDPEFLPGLLREVERETGDCFLAEIVNEKNEKTVCPSLPVVRLKTFMEKWIPLQEKSAFFLEQFPEEASSLPRLQVRARFALEVTDRKSLKTAEKLLLQTGRKPQDGVIARIINRRISLFLTRHLIKIGVTPNQWSIFTLLVGLSGAVCLALGRQFIVPGAILFELASIIDGSDGENARLTYRVSKTGGKLDIVGDAVTFVSFFAALPVGLYRTTGSIIWIYLGIFTFASMLGFYFLLIRYARKSGIGHNIVRVVKEIEAASGDPEFRKPVDKLAARIAFIYRRDFFSTAAFLLILLGLARVLIILVAVLSFLEAVYMASYSSRKLRQAAEVPG